MRLRSLSAALNAVLACAVVGAIAILHPNTPLPDHWNPARPLEISAPVTLVTPWKLRWAAASETACRAALAPLGPEHLPPIVDTDLCGIDPRVRIDTAGASDVAPVETTCAIALRLAMWDRHAVQPAAQDHFGVGVQRIEHFSSYSCRQIRTPSGEGARMSTHATAEAIDISGFVLTDGRRISLLSDWTDGTTEERAFLRDVRNGACSWFVTTLGPEFNALHADHFHLQSRGWGLCR